MPIFFLGSLVLKRELVSGLEVKRNYTETSEHEIWFWAECLAMGSRGDVLLDICLRLRSILRYRAIEGIDFYSRLCSRKKEIVQGPSRGIRLTVVNCCDDGFNLWYFRHVHRSWGQLRFLRLL